MGHAAALQFGPSQLVWTRVAGDAIDLAALGAGLSNRAAGRARGAVAALGLVGITAVDVFAAVRAQRDGDGQHSVQPGQRDLRAAVTVWRKPEEVYSFWRNFENLPSFMYHLKSVSVGPDGRSHWVANAPLGAQVQWDAEVTEDVPNQRIAWKSVAGAQIDNRGRVEFSPSPDGQGTEIRVTMSYAIPGGTLGKAVATLLGESPEQQVNDDLRRLKQLLETGGVVRSNGSPEGTAAVRQLHQRPAQPKQAASK
ncbi:SRPBCC family protein [Mycobacterium sp. M23085]|uniref:SRPBCC family protein n=1 Tax=Mycobacterium sp. M23085 TaxID=3378087 RepID=UPI00387801EF